MHGAGFKLADTNTEFTDVNMGNYKSATNPAIRPLVEQTIQEEIWQGNYVITATKPMVVSALEAIPKPNSTEIRLIHDCSRPHVHVASFWATCLVVFYGMFRKSHLLPTAPNLFDPNKQITKADFQLHHWGTLIIIRWSKTIQFRERIVDIPLPRIPHSELCPTAAIINAFRLNSSVSTQALQAFAWVDDRQASHVFPYGLFVSLLRRHLAAMGVDPELYAGHSFRWGGGGGVCILCVPIGRPH